jgi:hypothetical protein
MYETDKRQATVSSFLSLIFVTLTFSFFIASHESTKTV